MKLFTKLFILFFTPPFAMVAESALAERQMVFSGGPAGGTFQVMANAIQDYPPIKDIKDIKVQAWSSSGSVANLREVHRGDAHFGIVYSGHAYLGAKGLLKNDKKKYDRVRAVSFLYGAPAQLVVRRGLGIKSVKDLADKKVGVGNIGSGAYANSRLFFTHMGVWDKVQRVPVGYNDAAHAFENKQIDAFWLFTGFPSSAVVRAAQTSDIELINLSADAVASRFYHKYPYFSPIDMPAGTYKGVDKVTSTFEDSALWVANKDVSDDVVYNMLSIIYTEEGLAYIAKYKTSFKDMTIDRGTDGILTPLHPGAERFWKDKGVL